MSYVLLDDHFDEHPKYARLKLQHRGLMTNALSYSNRLLTDGRIDTKVVLKWGQKRSTLALVRDLIRLKIWESIEGGEAIQVVGYLDHNSSRKQVLERKASDRARKEIRKNDVGKFRAESAGSRARSPSPSPSPSPIRISDRIQKEIRIQKSEADPPSENCVFGVPPRATHEPNPECTAQPSAVPRKKPSVKKKTGVARELPINWVPEPARCERFCTKHRISRSSVLACLEHLARWAEATAAKKASWDATLEGWVLREIDRGNIIPDPPIFEPAQNESPISEVLSLSQRREMYETFKQEGGQVAI